MFEKLKEDWKTAKVIGTAEGMMIAANLQVKLESFFEKVARIFSRR